jgi:hypothetical protein
MVGLRRNSKLHNPLPSPKPNWPRRGPSFAGHRFSARHLLCAVAGAALLAIVPASALAAKTPSPDPAPGTSTPKPQSKPTPTHTTPKTTYTPPKTTYTPPATTHTTPTVTHYTPPAVTHQTVHKSPAKKKHHAARHHKKHHVVAHHKKKHVAAAPKTTPAPVQQPAAQVVNAKPTAQTLPVLQHKTSKDGNGGLLAFAALGLLMLAGGSAWLLRLTLRLAQPQRTY